MNVLIFSTAYLPFVGGAELAIKEITERITDASFSLITARFTRSLPKRERVGNVTVYRVGFGCFADKWLLPLFGFWLAVRLEKEHFFDVVWSMMASQASIASARFKTAFPEKKLVLTLQEGDEEEHLKRYVMGSDFLYRLFIRPWHTAVFTRADTITAISNYLAERARRNNATVPVVVVPNGVNVEAFSVERLAVSKEKRDALRDRVKIEEVRFKSEEIRRKLKLEESDKVIITVSRLVEKNGVGSLIESLRYLPGTIKLLICGTGQLESVLRLNAKRYTLNARVHFLGHISHEQLPQYLWISDVFCRPSLSEGMGSAFLEAMVAGVPVVATPVGGIPDFLFSPLPDSPEAKSLSAYLHELADKGDERITGLFCEVNNPKSIADKIQLLLSDAELRARIVANAEKMVREKYGWDVVAMKMKEVFHKSR